MKTNSATVRAVFKKETQRFYRFDFKDENIRGQFYLPKNLKVDILNIELIGNRKNRISKM
jgi:hypothetical protein